jgi:hypothetical protein
VVFGVANDGRSRAKVIKLRIALGVHDEVIHPLNFPLRAEFLLGVRRIRRDSCHDQHSRGAATAVASDYMSRLRLPVEHSRTVRV